MGKNSYGESCGERYEKFAKTVDGLLVADSIEALLRNYRALGEHLDHSHLAACWTSLGQLATRMPAEQCWLQTHAGMLEVLVQHTVRAAMAGEICGRDLAQVAFGTAYGGSTKSRVALFAALAIAAGQHMSDFSRRVVDFNVQNLATTSRALANIGQFDEKLFEVFVIALERRVDEFDEQNLAKVACAFATVDQSDKKLFAMLATSLQRRVGKFKAQAHANMAWAFAKVRQHDEKLFTLLVAAAEPLVSKFTSKNLANTVWAFAKVRQYDEKLLTLLAAAAEQLVSKFNSQALANMVWAFAKVDKRDEKLFAVVASVAERRVSKFDSQALSNM